jgi:hypothetical protein
MCGFGPPSPPERDGLTWTPFHQMKMVYYLRRSVSCCLGLHSSSAAYLDSSEALKLSGWWNRLQQGEVRMSVPANHDLSVWNVRPGV